MYTVSRVCRVYHIALNDSQTLCHYVFIYTSPEQRRRFDDWRVVAETPLDRICVLCSRRAELSGDARGFSERIIYPARSRAQTTIEPQT